MEEVSLKGVKKLMSYIYTGQVRLDGADEDTILGFLLVPHLYGFEKLLNPISRNLRRRLSILMYSRSLAEHCISSSETSKTPLTACWKKIQAILWKTGTYVICQKPHYVDCCLETRFMRRKLKSSMPSCGGAGNGKTERVSYRKSWR